MEIALAPLMPELPEVEALATALTVRLGGRVVTRCQLFSFAALKTVDPKLADLESRRVARVARFGKQLGIDFGDLWLVIHLARGGWLRTAAPTAVGPTRRSGAALRLLLAPDLGVTPDLALEVVEPGTEKRLGLWVTQSPTLVPGVATLGPDPLAADFSLPRFEQAIAHGNATLKAALTDQRRIAGIGDVYSDEILHRARLSPFQLTGRLKADQRAALHSAVVAVLKEATDGALGAAGEAPTRHRREAFKVHGRAGLTCPECHDQVRQVSYAQRALFYCPQCQTGGRILADRRMSRLLR